MTHAYESILAARTPPARGAQNPAYGPIRRNLHSACFRPERFDFERRAPYCSFMRIAKALLMALLGITLAAYAFDCVGAEQPQQAMQCCRSMPCRSHGHQSQNCCKTMSVAHAPFIQAPRATGFSVSIVAPAPVPGLASLLDGCSPEHIVAARSHAPPGYDFFSVTQLRV